MHWKVWTAAVFLLLVLGGCASESKDRALPALEEPVVILQVTELA